MTSLVDSDLRSFIYDAPAAIIPDEARIRIFYRFFPAERYRVDPLNDSYNEGADASADVVDIEGVSRPLTLDEHNWLMIEAETELEEAALRLEGVFDPAY